MVNVKGWFQFLRKQLGNFGILSVVLVALEQILDDQFVCPCDQIYNIIACVFFGAIPSIGCMVFTYRFLDQSKNTEDGKMRSNSRSVRCRYGTFMAAVWLSLFFMDGRYVACASSYWEGVYAKNDTFAIEKWCKPNGNETSVLESQKITLKWIFISQIIGFIIITVVIFTVACVNTDQRNRSQRSLTDTDTVGKMKLSGKLGEGKFSFDVEEVTCL